MTEGSRVAGREIMSFSCQGPMQNDRDFCGKAPKLQFDGRMDGTTIFVKTDCVTRKPLPMEDQDPIFRQPGVPLSRGDVTSMIRGWQANSCTLSYKISDDSFEILGKDWRYDDIDSLHLELKRRLVETEYNFDWISGKAEEYDWHIRGKLVIGGNDHIRNVIQNIQASGPGCYIDKR